ncbi:MAG: AAA family ATPase [Rubrivivax sp.]|nr:AAA family ATPase [Rubrivivax sp.]
MSGTLRQAIRVVADDDEPAVVRDFTGWPDGRIDRSVFEQAPEPRGWFAEHRLLAGRGHLVVGVGGSSKTRLLYHLAIASVIGSLPWAWTIAKTGSAALFLTEDVATDVHHALHLHGAALPPADRALLLERLRVFPLAGRHARLLELAGAALRETAVLGWLLQQLDALPPPVAFVGLDPALGLSEGDELNPAHARRFGELVDRIGIESGACCVATAHAAKAIHSADELGSHSARGSGAITDAVRGEFTLRNMTADEGRRFGISDVAERKRYVQLAATKGNHLPPEAFAPVWLARGIGGALAEARLETARASTIGGREMRALDILRESAPPGGGGIALKFWRDKCIAAGVIVADSPAAQEKAMTRVRESLVAAGLVASAGARGAWQAT